MRLSIWQQFSSNHSANFTVVAEFSAAEYAQKIVLELQQHLTDIASFWSNLSLEERVKWNEQIWDGKRTPPEDVIQKHYNVQWALWNDGKVRGLDWLQSGVEQAIDAVHHYKNFVIVEPVKVETWVGQKPFDEILEKLGGKVVYEIENVKEDIFWNVEFEVSVESEKEKLKHLFLGSIQQCTSSLLVVEVDEILVDSTTQLSEHESKILLQDFQFNGRFEQHHHLHRFEEFLNH